MMSCLTALVACGPEMTGDEETLLASEDLGQELQTSQKSLKEIGLTEVGCTTTSALSNGVAKTGLSAASKAWSCIYTIAPPAGSTNLKFETTDGTGDADLYVKFGSAPTDGVYDLSSAYSSGNTESINVATPQSGTYYVRFFGYSAVSGLTLKASYTYGTPTSCTTTYTLTNGSLKSGLGAGEKLWSCIYKLYVPTGASNLKFETSGGTGDADLYVKLGATPTDTSSDCSSASYGNNETCTIPAPQAGYYYVRLFGYHAAADVALVGSYTTGGTTPGNCTTTYTLTNGSYTTGISVGEQLYSCTYVLNVPAGKTSVLFQTFSGTGDADLYVKFGSAPTTTSYDAMSMATGNTESILISTPQAGNYYVRLYGYAAAAGVLLKGQY